MNQADSENPVRARRKCFGLVRRKEVWALTWRGWLALFVFVTVAGVVFVRGVHDFLAVSAPVETPVTISKPSSSGS
mgnify:CR=1 FL=1